MCNVLACKHVRQWQRFDHFCSALQDLAQGVERSELERRGVSEGCWLALNVCSRFAHVHVQVFVVQVVFQIYVMYSGFVTYRSARHVHRLMDDTN